MPTDTNHSRAIWRQMYADTMKTYGRHLLGILLLLGVVLLWTGASFLMSYIFTTAQYDKPFFTTFVNTGSFVVYLIIWSIQSAFKTRCVVSERVIPPNDDESAISSRTGSPDALLNPADGQKGSTGSSSSGIESLDYSEKDDDAEIPIADAPKSTPLTFRETAMLSLQFCLIWFLANYFVNASLKLTSVAASTVLSSTASLWTLIIGVVVGVESFSFTKLLSVGVSFAGVLLISLGQPGDDPNEDGGLKNYTLGNIFAFLSAIFYGLYITLIKHRVGDEGRVSTVLFFGLVGVFNLVFLWPFFFALDALGIEEMELPPTSHIWSLILLNSFIGTCLSEYLWMLAMLLTSPLIATMGLSLSIPLSMVGDFVKGTPFTAQFMAGALMVLIGFLVSNLAGIYKEWDQSVDNVVRKGCSKIKQSIWTTTGRPVVLEEESRT